MSNYLKNPICNFKPHFKYDPNKKYNIISLSLFKMTEGYKNFNIYINGFKNIIQFRNKYMPDFIIRLFVDSTILNDENLRKLIFSDDNIQVVEYNCPNYLTDSKTHHIGTFGTFIRFFQCLILNTMMQTMCLCGMLI